MAMAYGVVAPVVVALPAVLVGTVDGGPAAGPWVGRAAAGAGGGGRGRARGGPAGAGARRRRWGGAGVWGSAWGWVPTVRVVPAVLVAALTGVTVPEP